VCGHQIGVKGRILAAVVAFVALAGLSCSQASSGPAPGGHTVAIPGIASDTGAAPGPAGAALLDQAKTADPERHRFAMEKGARVVDAAGGRAFALVWYPPGTGPEKPPVIATISGHASWAFDELFLWQPYAAERGYGVIALQWWLGAGERPQDYLSPQEVNREFALLFEAEGIRPGTVLLHGFSRGSANIFGVTALDRAAGTNYYLATIANAGKPGADFPINRDMLDGKFGPAPLDGTNWVLFCGRRDDRPGRDGCDGMDEAAGFVERFGGTVSLFIQDPRAGHGGFHRTPAHVNAALDTFARLLAERGTP